MLLTFHLASVSTVTAANTLPPSYDMFLCIEGLNVILAGRCDMVTVDCTVPLMSTKSTCTLTPEASTSEASTKAMKWQRRRLASRSMSTVTPDVPLSPETISSPSSSASSMSNDTVCTADELPVPPTISNLLSVIARLGHENVIALP